MSYLINQLSLAQSHFIRKQVFSSDSLDGLVHIEQNLLSTTEHFGVLDEQGNAIACASLVWQDIDKKPTSLLTLCTQTRIRAVSVLPAYQGKGVGTCLINHLVFVSKNKNADFVWLSSLAEKAKFYEKLGFSVYGHAYWRHLDGLSQKMIFRF